MMLPLSCSSLVDTCSSTFTSSTTSSGIDDIAAEIASSIVTKHMLDYDIAQDRIECYLLLFCVTASITNARDRIIRDEGMSCFNSD